MLLGCDVINIPLYHEICCISINPIDMLFKATLLGSQYVLMLGMILSFYDVIDKWTTDWNRPSIEIILDQVSTQFYEHKFLFFLLEKIWDALELIDDPLEFMTEERKVQQIENILSNERNERAAKFVKIEIVESPELQITILNTEETIAQHPGWFEPLERDTLDEVVDTNSELDET